MRKLLSDKLGKNMKLKSMSFQKVWVKMSENGVALRMLLVGYRFGAEKGI